LTTLGALAATVQAEGLQSPSIIVVGDVVQGARAWAAQSKTSHKTA
jgi:uroporphyrin-III C-methyltransferase